MNDENLSRNDEVAVGTVVIPAWDGVPRLAAWLSEVMPPVSDEALLREQLRVRDAACAALSAGRQDAS
jgi:hypothetical protein